MSANRYFWLVIASGGMTLVALILLAAKNFQPIYQTVLQLCGQFVQNCQTLISELSPVGLFAAASLSWLVFLLASSILKTWLAVRGQDQKSYQHPKILRKIERSLGLEGSVSLGSGRAVFCSGLLRPRIDLGADLLKLLTEPELRAVLIHEAYHLRNHDPLKVWLVGGLSRAFFFLPAISELGQAYLKEKELAADLAAKKVVGRAPLAKALYKALATDSSNLGIAYFAAERERILSLRGDVITFRFNSWAWIVSLFALLFLTTSLFKPAAALGGC